MLLKIGALLLLFKLIYGQSETDPIVQTEVGSIRGLQADDGDYAMFLGIPYGKVDLENPFGASEPYPNFENIYEANNDSTVCPQKDLFGDGFVGSLDCLRLNVYVPHSATSLNRLPVLVWIHGGGFMSGFNNRYLYAPNFFLRHGIIFVAINYRVGPYGFMCLDTPQIPGNQGIKDQLLALRWIKTNIGSFGGDDNNITIFGESAGSGSVDIHLVSHNEKLYNKAILQSLTVLSPVFSEPLKTAPQMIAEQLGFVTNNLNDALNFLANTESNLVISTVHALGTENDFRPCIEKKFEGVESIITRNWITADLPKVADMPILIGFTDDEMYEYHLSEEDEYYRNLNLVDTQLANGFNVNNDSFENEMEDIVHQYYFNDNELSLAVRREVIDFTSDFRICHPTKRSIYKYLDNGVGNIYFYMFSYVGQRNFMRIISGITSETGAIHADELGYQFDVSFMRNVPLTPEDEEIIDRMSLLWTNFVKYGDPTPETSDLLPVKWTPVTNKEELPYLEIGSQLILKSRPFHERLAFWDLFYSANQEHVIPYKGYTESS